MLQWGPMEGFLFTNNSVLSMALSNSGLILFGALLIVYGLVLGLVFVLHSNHHIYRTVVGGFAVILLLLLGILALDFSGASGSYFTFDETRELSELLSTHRWLIIQLPILLTISSIGILLTYRERISDAHAKEYRFIVQYSTCISLFTILLIALE